MLAVVAVSGGCAAAPERRVTRASFGKVLRTLSTDSLRQGGAGAGWLGSSAGGLRPGYLVLLKLLQETPMTMALSSRLTSVRARWRAARDSTDSLPAQWQRWPGSPSRGRVAQARRAMSGDRGENAMCHLLSLSS